MNKPVILGLLVGLSACAPLTRAVPVAAEQPAAEPPEASLVVAGQSAAAFDTTTATQRAAALAQPAAGSEVALGSVVVALGSPAEQGLWLSSGLVGAAGKGRVVATGGASVAVDLRPGTGGALLSLAAFQALGLKLTDLPEVTVFGP